MSELGRPHPAVERYVSKAVSPNDRIEALEAEVERLTRQLEVSQDAIDRLMGDLGKAALDLAAARAEQDEWQARHRKATLSLMSAVSAYREFAKGHDALYSTRLGDYERAVEAALAALPKVVEDDAVPPDAVVMRYGDKSVTITNLALPKEDDDAL